MIDKWREELAAHLKDEGINEDVGYTQGYLAACKKRSEEIDQWSEVFARQSDDVKHLGKEIEALKKENERLDLKVFEFQTIAQIQNSKLVWTLELLTKEQSDRLKEIFKERNVKDFRDEIEIKFQSLRKLVREAKPWVNDYLTIRGPFTECSDEVNQWLEKAERVLEVK